MGVVPLCVQFLLCLEPRPIFVAATVKKELNNRVCVCLLCLGGVLLLAALSWLAAPPPSPLTLQLRPEGARQRKGEGAE